jgi:large repetitive protein
VAVTGPSIGAPVAPTGVVSFTATNTATSVQIPLGTGALNGSQASISSTGLAVGTYTFTATYLGDGNFTASPASIASAVVTINPGVVATGAAISGTVGTPISQTVATFTDPTGAQPVGTYSASINWGDGTAPSAGTITVSGGTFSVAGTHTYTNAGPFTVTVAVTRTGAPTPVAVTDAATIIFPQVIFQNVFPVTATIGRDTGTVNLATFTDPSGPDLIANYSATINWGDGTPNSTGIIGSNGNGTFTVSGNHTYAAKGTNSIDITIGHLSAVPTSISTSATVSASIIQISTLNPPSTLAVGAGFVGLVGTYVDSNPTSTAANFEVGVYWGDGTYSIGQVLALGTDANGNQVFGVYSFHTYTTAGGLAFAMGVYDVDGALATASTISGTINVYNPTVMANLIAYNTNLVNAVVEYNIYITLAIQTQSNYAIFLAQYWLSVFEANLNAYHALAATI